MGAMPDHDLAIELQDLRSQRPQLHTQSGDTRAGHCRDPFLAERLSSLESITHGKFQWSETAGLKQIIREQAMSNYEALKFLESDYANNLSRKAA
jgi:hypothetical protein